MGRVREKIFRNEEAGLSLEGFLDALGPRREALGRDAEAAGLRDQLDEYQTLLAQRADFEEVATVGRGHFGVVKLVHEKRRGGGAAAGGKVYAMKRMAKEAVTPAAARLERSIMSKARSDWITSLKYAFQDSRYLFLVMEYCPGGDLRSLLDR